GKCSELGARVERRDELRVPSRLNRCLRRQQADPAVASRLDGGMRLGLDHADDRDGEGFLKLGQCRGGRRVAGDEHELDPLALVVVASAAASYTPSMGIFQATYKPAGAGAVTIIVAQETADDPTARIVIYAPQGYKATLTQAPGMTIGNVLAHVQVLDLSTNVLPLSGQVK